MNKKQLIFGALLGLPTLANADVNFSIDDITIAANEQRTVYVNVELTDESQMSGFEMEVQLPAGLVFVGTDDVWTSNQINTEYGWTLTRNAESETKYKFVGFTPKDNRILKDQKRVAFQFDVKALAGFNPKTVGDIKMTNIEVSDLSNPPLYDVEGLINGKEMSKSKEVVVNGDVNGIYRLIGGEKNFISVDGKSEVTLKVTPKHKVKVTVQLNNHPGEDPITHEPLGDPDVRGLQGIIHLPKGLKVVEGSEAPAYRTINEDINLGTPEVDGEGTQVAFDLFASAAPLRNCDIYGTEIFSFEIEGDEVANFDQQVATITIDNFVASKFGDALHSYTLDDVITLTIENDNQVAKDNTYDPAIADMHQAYNDQVAAVPKDINQSSKVLAQEQKAQEAMQDYEDEVQAQYEAGTLHEWTDPDGLKQAADDEIAAIATIAEEVEKIAKDNGDQANKWINNSVVDGTDFDVPDYLNQYEAITPIKDERNENAGSLKDAKKALFDAFEDSKENGLLGDNIDSHGNMLDKLIGEVQKEIDNLKLAVEQAEAAKKANDDAVAAVKKEYALEDNFREDDTPGTYAAAIEALDNAVKAAAEAGKQADKDIYAAEIQAVIDAYDTVAAKAEANNKAAADAIDDFKLPDYCAEDDGALETSKAGTWYAAKKVLEDAVDAAEEAGTQAKDDIYKAEIEALEQAQKDVIAKAEANNKLVDEALAVTPKPIPDEVRANPGVVEAKEAFDIAAGILMSAKFYAAENGTQAKDDVYKESIDNYNTTMAALNAAIDAAVEVAEANEAAVNDALAINPVLPEGTDCNDAYENIQDSPVIKNLEGALQTAKENLQDALDQAKAEGTLGDTPSPMADEIEAVQNANDELQKELDAQSAQAKENFEAFSAFVLDFMEVQMNYDGLRDDVKACANVKALYEVVKNGEGEYEDPTGELAEAIKAVIDQYEGNMVANNTCGDPDETQTLKDLLQAFQEKKAEFEKEAEIATEAMEAVDNMNEQLEELAGDLYLDDDSELVKAKVVDPATVTKELGKIVPAQWKGMEGQAQWQAMYDKLLNDMSDQVDFIQNAVNFVKALFTDGLIGLEDVKEFLNGDDDPESYELPALIAKAREEVEAELIDYISTVERGDVGGDGRWTTNDYALQRKMILSEDYPHNTPEVDSAERYEFARYDINHDNKVNVGDAQAALNYTFYGNLYGPVAEARTVSGAESLMATMTGNRIAVSLNNARLYSAFQIDVVLPEGMTVSTESLAARNEGFSIASSDLGNGVHRILVTATEAGKGFAGNEGDVLYIDVEGQGTVEFQNIIFSDVNTNTVEFQLAAVSGGTTGIAAAKAQAEGEQVYSITGRVMNSLKKGINIIRRADGTSQKVIKK